MLSVQQFSLYCIMVSVARNEFPSWREGQAYFNVLKDMHPEIADEIRGGLFDPFYDDDTVTAFIAELYTNYVIQEA